MSSYSVSVSDIRSGLLEYPQSFLYAHAITLMMIALYESSPLVAAWGGLLFVATAWYTGVNPDDR